MITVTYSKTHAIVSAYPRKNINCLWLPLCFVHSTV